MLVVFEEALHLAHYLASQLALAWESRLMAAEGRCCWALKDCCCWKEVLLASEVELYLNSMLLMLPVVKSEVMALEVHHSLRQLHSVLLSPIEEDQQVMRWALDLAMVRESD
jgi:hypothetical protein